MSIVKADLCYKSKGEQAQLLQQVLAASDADAGVYRLPPLFYNYSCNQERGVIVCLVQLSPAWPLHPETSCADVP